jgi:hypothetical protein
LRRKESMVSEGNDSPKNRNACTSRERRSGDPAILYVADRQPRRVRIPTTANEPQPLTDPALRAAFHGDAATQETPLFLHPAQQDPEQHIEFRREILYALNGSRSGQKTIKALGLDREILN